MFDPVMFDPLSIICFLALAVFISFPLLVNDKTLERMWSLRPLDKSWDERFPDMEYKEIYEFLDMLVASFGYDGKHRLNTQPSSKVSDVYKALFPPDGEVDARELQTFILAMKEEYGVDLTEADEPWEMAVGDLFSMAKGLDKAKEPKG